MESWQSPSSGSWTNAYRSHIVRKESDISNRPLRGRCSCRTAKPPPPPVQQKHLYLLLDDWDKGYSVYRVSEDDFVVSDADDSSAQDDGGSGQEAESPLVRIKAGHRSWMVAGHGTKILVMNPAQSSPGIPVFDTATLSMTVCPSTYTRGGHVVWPVYASVGDRFLSFVDPLIDVLGPEPAALSGEGSAWSWFTIAHYLPFGCNDVCGYAVHPDGRTVFMSVYGYNPDAVGSTRSNCVSTYAFDMECFDWTYIGEWILPFRGQGHYDRELDAWVGICSYSCQIAGGAGRVCCCDVPPDAEPRDAEPTWRLCVDVLFHPGDLHFGAKLVYMGDSKFCLVEARRRVQMEDDDDGRGRYLRDVKMTTFVLKYDKVGDLRTTRRRGHASMWYRSQKRGDPANDPAAFWM